MAPIRFLNLVKPVMFLIPEIQAPTKAISKKDKFIWTAIALFIYLICCQFHYTEFTNPLTQIPYTG